MRHFLLLLLCCGTLSIYAQEAILYDWFVGGTINGQASAQDTDSPRLVQVFDGFGNPLFDFFGNPVTEIIDERRRINRSIVNFNPILGKQITEHWLVGISAALNYSLAKDNRGQGAESDSRTVQIGLGFNARYVINPQNKVQAILQSGLSAGRGTSSGRFNDEDWEKRTTFTSIGASATLGAQMSLGTRLRLLTFFDGVSYTHRKSKDEIDDSEFFTSSFSFDLIPSEILGNLAIGVEYKF